MKKHELPKLEYSYDGLEPHIDSKTVELHYSKHHQGYVNGLNNAEEALEKARKENDFSKVKHLKREIAFNGSGHLLHSIYWANMCPVGKAKEKPEGKLLSAIESKYGSFEIFMAEFKASTLIVEGSGWGILALIDNELEILTVEKHQNTFLLSSIPILVCDVWEHAYYLKYQNNRATYIENFSKVINWADVEKRYEKSLK